jgi:hypothetical protein
MLTTETKPDEGIDEPIAFTAHDRCDQCAAQAYHVAYKEGSASELLFCNHHYQQNDEALLLKGWNVASDVSKLYEGLSSTLTKPETV